MQQLTIAIISIFALGACANSSHEQDASQGSESQTLHIVVDDEGGPVFHWEDTQDQAVQALDSMLVEDEDGSYDEGCQVELVACKPPTCSAVNCSENQGFRACMSLLFENC